MNKVTIVYLGFSSDDDGDDTRNNDEEEENVLRYLRLKTKFGCPKRIRRAKILIN